MTTRYLTTKKIVEIFLNKQKTDIVNRITQYLDGLLLVKKNSLYFRNMKFRYSRLLETLLQSLYNVIEKFHFQIFANEKSHYRIGNSFL